MNKILELAISLVFVYALLSIIVSSVQEIMSRILNTRGRMLQHAICEVFNDITYNKNYAHTLYEHPAVDYLREKYNSLPSYISSSQFADAIIGIFEKEDELAKGEFKKKNGKLVFQADVKDDLFDRVKDGIDAMNYSDLKVLLLGIVNQSKNAAEFKENISKWFDEYMDRVSGWYKRSTTYILYTVGITVAVVLNADSIELSRAIWNNDSLRQTMVITAENYAKNNPLPVTADSMEIKQHFEDIKEINQQLSQINSLPIGWDFSAGFGTGLCKELCPDWFLKIMGWLITAFALSFGAPFWFNALNKLIDLRGSGKKPEQSSDKK